MRLLTTVCTVVAVLVTASSVGAAQPTQVGAVDFKFDAKKVTIKKGGKVTWTNIQGRHNVTSSKGGFDEDITGAGETFTHKFKKAGTFNYVCSFHVAQGMKGKVVVK